MGPKYEKLNIVSYPDFGALEPLWAPVPLGLMQLPRSHSLPAPLMCLFHLHYPQEMPQLPISSLLCNPLPTSSDFPDTPSYYWGQ